MVNSQEQSMAEKTELHKKFEAECSIAFPDYFDFTFGCIGQYVNELTRHTFAGYELSAKGAQALQAEQWQTEDDGSGNLILIFVETRIFNEGTEFYREETAEYQVSTRKLAAFIEDSSGYDYVKHIIEHALHGTPLRASRKYSFGDTPDWWEELKPTIGCKDPIKRFEYEIYCS
jgi:hypothetical protein